MSELVTSLRSRRLGLPRVTVPAAALALACVTVALSFDASTHAAAVARSHRGNSASVSGINLDGFLVRDEHGRFAPAVGSNATSFAPSLQLMTSTAPAPYGYPGSDVAAYQAAELQLYNILARPSGPLNSACSGCVAFPAGLRINYGNVNFTNAIPNIRTALNCQSRVGEVPGPLAGEYPSPPPPQYTQSQLDQMRGMVCNEMIRQSQVETDLFAPLRQVITGEETDGTLDLMDAGSTLSGYVQQSAPVPGLDPLGMAGSISTLLGSMVEDLGPELEGVEEAGQILSLAGDVMTAAAAFNRSGTIDQDINHQLGEISVESGLLAAWVEARYADAAGSLDELESQAFADPDKLLALYTNSGSTGPWNLGTATNTNLTRTDAIRFQAQLSALNYMYPKLIGAAAQPSCQQERATDTSPPMSYTAWVDIGQQSNLSATGLGPFGAQINSLKFSTQTQASLSRILFSDGGATYNNGAFPAAASIVQSDFYLLQMLNNNAGCTYNSGLCCLFARDIPTRAPANPAVADRRRRSR